jgi:hypothetical protein
MFTKKFLESNFTPLTFITSRRKKSAKGTANGANANGAEAGTADMSRTNATNGTNGDAPESLLSRHKGKLAVGAAAMLGLAAYYHWRESKLAKEDEEEYARLQRLKAALDAFESRDN